MSETDKILGIAILVFVIVCIVLVVGYLRERARKKRVRENLENSSKIYKRILKTIFFQFYEHETDSSHLINQMGIYKVDLDIDDTGSVENEPYTITIHLRSPGLIIGKAGRTIDELKKAIAEEFSVADYRVSIKLEEVDPFKNMFT